MTDSMIMFLLKICTTQALNQFVIVGPPLTGRVGDNQAKVCGNYFFIVPEVQV